MALRILGVDPGSRVLGYGIIEVSPRGAIHIDHGVIDVNSIRSFSERLKIIGQKLNVLIDQYKPDQAVLEKIFLAKNVDSAFKLGHARGVCVFQLSSAGVPIFEYEARVVKKSIAGTGAAEKEQVRRLVLAMLRIQSSQALDATDALALALHHERILDIKRRFEGQKIDLPQDFGDAL